MPENSSARTCLIVGVVTFFSAMALMILCVVRVHDGEPTGPFIIGETSTQKYIEWPIPVFILPSVDGARADGFDGQYYLMLAFDPFLQSDIAGGLDRPHVRVRRVSVPLLAWITGLGQPSLILYTFYFWNALFIAVGAWALASWAAARDESPWWGLAFAVSLGTFITLWRMMGDAWATAMMLAMFWFFYDKKARLAGVAMFLMLISKETLLFAAGAILLQALWEKRRREFAWLAAGMAAAFAWWGYGTWAARNMTDFGETLFNFTWPVIGPFKALFIDLGMEKAASHKAKDILFFAAHIYGIVIGLGVGAWTVERFFKERKIDGVGLAFGAYALMTVFFSHYVWEEVWGYGRIVHPIAVLALLWGLQYRRAEGKAGSLAVASLWAGALIALCGAAFAGLQILRGTM
jgi:hypothetical protein